MSNITETVQSFSPGEQIALYSLDATSLGGDVYHFCSGTISNQPIQFGGITYVPIDLEVSGFEWSGQGAMPRPKIKVSNAASFLAAVVINYSDLLGATITRIRTYKKYLDGQPEADPNAILPVDIYRIDRKSNYNKVYIEWELASVMDQEGRMLPGRQVIKHNCTLIYRYYNPQTGMFDYTKATCPYVGTAYFDRTDTATTDISADGCSKLLTGCQLRFGLNTDLPFGGFPGAGANDQG